VSRRLLSSSGRSIPNLTCYAVLDKTALEFEWWIICFEFLLVCLAATHLSVSAWLRIFYVCSTCCICLLMSALDSTMLSAIADITCRAIIEVTPDWSRSRQSTPCCAWSTQTVSFSNQLLNCCAAWSARMMCMIQHWASACSLEQDLQTRRCKRVLHWPLP